MKTWNLKSNSTQVNVNTLQTNKKIYTQIKKVQACQFLDKQTYLFVQNLCFYLHYSFRFFHNFVLLISSAFLETTYWILAFPHTREATSFSNIKVKRLIWMYLPIVCYYKLTGRFRNRKISLDETKHLKPRSKKNAFFSRTKPIYKNALLSFDQISVIKVTF